MITGIGSSIVDFLINVDQDSVLTNYNIVKGSMNLIDENKANFLDRLRYDRISHGGSIANSIYNISGLGIKSSIISHVGNDNFGKFFAEEMAKKNVNYHNVLPNENRTSKSFIFITKDGERSMATYLNFQKLILDKKTIDIIKNSRIIYIEGYLLDIDGNREYLSSVMELCNENDIKIAFSLSDPFCCKRNHEMFMQIFTKSHIVIANIDEWKSLLNGGVNEICNISDNDKICVVTNSSEGCFVIKNGEISHVKTNKIQNPIDTTGAGDAFASGFFYGILKDYSILESAKFGNELAGRVIQKIGAAL